MVHMSGVMLGHSKYIEQKLLVKSNKKNILIQAAVGVFVRKHIFLLLTINNLFYSNLIFVK